MNEPAGAGYSQAAVQHHPNRRSRLHTRQAAGQKRIIRLHGADPDQYGIGLRSQQMRARLRSLARDRHWFAAGGANLVVGGHRALEDDMGSAVADAPEVSGMIARGLEAAC